MRRHEASCTALPVLSFCFSSYARSTVGGWFFWVFFSVLLLRVEVFRKKVVKNKLLNRVLRRRRDLWLIWMCVDKLLLRMHFIGC